MRNRDLHWNGGVFESKDAEDDCCEVREAHTEAKVEL